MKLKNPMLVVTDIDKSVAFYKKVFGLHVIMDFGANKTLTGGLALQTVETYKDFIRKNDIRMTNLLSLKQQEVAEMANEDKKILMLCCTIIRMCRCSFIKLRKL